MNLLSLSSAENSELKSQLHSFARTPRKTPFPTVLDACLQLRCLATHFLRLRDFALRGPHRIHGSLLLLPLFVFTELLPGNALMKYVKIYLYNGAYVSTVG
jgi:hypothetical protein